jgi:hypothetical protein
MDDHAFDFFAQLLKNMMRKFMQLKDMVAAKLVTSVASNISRCVRCCVAHSRAIVFASMSLRLSELKSRRMCVSSTIRVCGVFITHCFAPNYPTA